eukprot:TRINITY_DN13699_c0_g1_i1.p1 TRINITY_DN13699_c0_g1~~TRINITY_DN13699_c0_g1_i1.p1  ORF type:complete len:310 (+),score=81.21 TRINITY_DN13699_c0_g1_i1:83-1012(+)
MNSLTEYCRGCNYNREYLLELPCCSATFCEECMRSVTRCGRCMAPVEIKECRKYKSDLQAWIDDIIKPCRYQAYGCKEVKSEFLIHQHEKNCSFAPDSENIYLTAFIDPSQTKEALQLERRKNVFENFLQFSNVKLLMGNYGLNSADDQSAIFTREATPGGSDDEECSFYTHIVIESDTLAGLAVKYDVSMSIIKQVNKLGSNNIFERSTLKIPKTKNKPTFNQLEIDQLERILTERVITRFKREGNLLTNEEAFYYLDTTNFNYQSAMEMCLMDSNWEQSNHFQSQIREKCKVKQPKIQKNCCLVFAF